MNKNSRLAVGAVCLSVVYAAYIVGSVAVGVPPADGLVLSGVTAAIVLMLRGSKA